MTENTGLAVAPGAGYTPGPWRAYHHGEDWPWSAIIPTECEKHEGCNDSTMVEGLSEADARLIAAAPDLLEALERIAGPSGDPGFDKDPAVEWRRRVARDVLAKTWARAERTTP